jgi:hypothetical protein
VPRALGPAAGIVAALLVFGCGAPDELSREEAQRIGAAAERLDDAIDTHETIRTSRVEARRLRSRVRAIVSRGSFESERLDEFGRAALAALGMVVPSLVVSDRDGVPTRLDRPALRAFLRFATSDPDRALGGPARRSVDAIESVIEDSDADGETRVPPADPTASGHETVDQFLRRVERDLRPIFPALAHSVRQTRDEL